MPCACYPGDPSTVGHNQHSKCLSEGLRHKPISRGRDPLFGRIVSFPSFQFAPYFMSFMERASDLDPSWKKTYIFSY